MDPITLATVTAGITALASEYVKGFASEAGKDTWERIKSLFGWSAEPPTEELAPSVARKLQDEPELAKQIVALLQQQQTGTASTLVGSIDAEKVVVADKIDTVNM